MVSLIVVSGLSAKEVFFMKKFILLFKDSAKELKDIRCITISAMLGGLAVALNLIAFASDTLKVGINSLPGRIVYYLFGPFVGAVFGGAMDLLNYFVRPLGPFHPGFTLNALLSGVIFGVILYKKPLKLYRIFIATFINAVFINVILNTFWISTIAGRSFWIILPPRLLKNAIFFPIEALLLFFIIKGVEATGVFRLIKQ